VIDFGILPYADGEGVLRAVRRVGPLDGAWLRAEVTRTGGPAEALDAGREGLVHLWRWFADQVDAPGPDATAPDGQPPWHGPDPNPYLSARTLWPIDAVGGHLAQLAQAAVPEARWDVFRVAPKFGDFNQRRAMLHGLPGRPADPAQVAYGPVIAKVYHHEPFRPVHSARAFARRWRSASTTRVPEGAGAGREELGREGPVRPAVDAHVGDLVPRGAVLGGRLRPVDGPYHRSRAAARSMSSPQISFEPAVVDVAERPRRGVEEADAPRGHTLAGDRLAASGQADHRKAAAGPATS